MATPKVIRVSELVSTKITNYQSYIQVLKKPIAISEGIIVAFETSMRPSLLDTHATKRGHKIDGLFIQKILKGTNEPSEFARYSRYATIPTASQHKFINDLIGTEEERAYLEVNALIKKIGNEPQSKAKGAKSPKKKRHSRHIAVDDFISTETPSIHTHYRKRLVVPIDVDIGEVIGFDTTILKPSRHTPIPQHEICYYYVRLKLVSGLHSNFITRYLFGNIPKHKQEFLDNEIKKSSEYDELVTINKELEIRFNELKEVSKELYGKQGLIRKPFGKPSLTKINAPKEIERKFLPSTDEINGSWLKEVLTNFISTKDINQAYVNLDTVKFHIAEDTVFLQSLDTTMSTPIAAVTVGIENCLILKELFAGTEKKVIRIRKQDQHFFFTIKIDIGKHGECVEIEVPIDLQTYTALKMYCGREISKIRMTVLHEGMNYEVDLFKGNIFGFTLIEVEVPAIDHPLNLPAWVGTEVTGSTLYYNNNLLSYNSYKDGILYV